MEQSQKAAELAAAQATGVDPDVSTPILVQQGEQAIESCLEMIDREEHRKNSKQAASTIQIQN